MNPRPNRAKRFTYLSVAVAMTATLLAPTAGGQTADDLRSRAQDLEAQLNEAESRELALGEQMNAAAERLAEAQDAIEEAQQRIATAQAEADRLKEMVNSRAASAYKQAGAGNAFSDLDVESANELETRSKYSSAAASKDEQLRHQLTLAQEELAVQREEAERIRGEARAEREAVESARAEAQAATAEIERLQSQVRGELAELVEQERAAREAAARREAQQQAEQEQQAASQAPAPAQQSAPAGGTGGAPSGPVPGANGGAGGAVAFAMSKLGGPYCWGGTGPSCYDCSGLTQAAWAHAGVSIPRTSGAQFSAFPQVPLSAVQPGDLLFYAGDNGGSGHVAMATGGGMMVHATSSRNNPNAIRHDPIAPGMVAKRPG